MHCLDKMAHLFFFKLSFQKGVNKNNTTIYWLCNRVLKKDIEVLWQNPRWRTLFSLNKIKVISRKVLHNVSYCLLYYLYTVCILLLVTWLVYLNFLLVTWLFMYTLIGYILNYKGVLQFFRKILQICNDQMLKNNFLL